MRNLEVRIAQVRRDKQAAIDVQDFEQAVALRDAEKQLIEERARVEQETAAGAESAGEASVEGAGAVAGAGAGAEGAGAVAGIGADVEGEGAGEPDELGRLRARVADLESQLREHGIDPDEPGEAPAATG
ncbi:MAG TPA: UvrB/UvrC motif-containing protein [Streptosporangiaceae bacterium]|nr:UvrB/UvrC motif-containing protein [Streptosporangiaceae bacterium]